MFLVDFVENRKGSETIEPDHVLQAVSGGSSAVASLGKKMSAMKANANNTGRVFCQRRRQQRVGALSPRVCGRKARRIQLDGEQRHRCRAGWWFACSWLVGWLPSDAGCLGATFHVVSKINRVTEAERLECGSDRESTLQR